jgi:hypothetical protein
MRAMKYGMMHEGCFKKHDACSMQVWWHILLFTCLIKNMFEFKKKFVLMQRILFLDKIWPHNQQSGLRTSSRIVVRFGKHSQVRCEPHRNASWHIQ